MIDERPETTQAFLFRSVLRRPVTSAVLAALILQLGLVSLHQLPLSFYPPSSATSVTVVTRYPGADPETLEKEITRPLERSLSDLRGLEHMVSEIHKGTSRIHLIFAPGDSLSARINQASEKILSVARSFPAQVNRPYIIEYNSRQGPVFAFSLKSTEKSRAWTYRYARHNLKSRFQEIPGVSEVSVVGGSRPEVQIICLPRKMSPAGKRLDRIHRTVSRDNTVRKTGTMSVRNSKRQIASSRLDASIDSVRELATLPLSDGRLLQWCKVQKGTRPETRISRTNGSRQINIFLNKSDSGSMLSVTNQARSLLRDLDLPFDMVYEPILDRGVRIKNTLASLMTSSLTGMCIASTVLLIFLRKIQIAFFTALSIPFSLIGAAFFLQVCEIELHTMTLSAFALSGGLLIDNAIVVSDRLARLEPWKSQSNRVILETILGQSARELLGGTATTLIAFLPVYLIPAISRSRYVDFAAAISFCLLLGYCYSLVVLPNAILHWKWHPEKPGPPAALLIRSNLFRLITRGRNLFSSSVFPYLAKLQSAYHRASNTLSSRQLFRTVILLSRRSKLLIWICAGSCAVLAGALIFAPRSMAEVDKRTTIQARVSLPTGIHLKESERLFQMLESRASQSPGIQRVDSRIKKNRGTLFLRPVPGKHSRKAISRIKENLKRSFQKVPDAFVHFQENSRNNFALRFSILGPEFARLREIGSGLARRLQSLSEVQEVVFHYREEGKYLDFHPDTSIYERGGPSPALIADRLQTYLTGKVISKMYNGQEMDVRLKGDWKASRGISALRKIPINRSSKSVELKDLGRFSVSSAESEIWRINKRRSLALSAEMQEPVPESAIREIQNYFNEEVSDSEYSYLLDRNYRERKRSFRRLILAVLVALLLIYFLLGALMESFLQPALIFITLPLPLLLALSAQLIFQGNLSHVSLFALMMLAGLIANGGIIMVFSMVRALHGQKRRLAPFVSLRILRSARDRIRPVMITSLTTILGMLPLLFSSHSGFSWQAVSLVTISGTLAAIPVVLILIPSLCFSLLLGKSAFRTGAHSRLEDISRQSIQTGMRLIKSIHQRR